MICSKKSPSAFSLGYKLGYESKFGESKPLPNLKPYPSFGLFSSGYDIGKNAAAKDKALAGSNRNIFA